MKLPHETTTTLENARIQPCRFDHQNRPTRQRSLERRIGRLLVVNMNVLLVIVVSCMDNGQYIDWSCCSQRCKSSKLLTSRLPNNLLAARARTHTRMHARAYARAHTRACAHVRTRAHMQTQVHGPAHAHAHGRTRMDARKDPCTHTRPHVHTRTRVHMYTGNKRALEGTRMYRGYRRVRWTVLI